MANKIIHKHSAVVNGNVAKLPSPEMLEYGELAVNYAAGNETVSFKNNNDEIVTIRTNEYLTEIIEENELITAEALINLDNRVIDLENAPDPETYFVLNTSYMQDEESSAAVFASLEEAYYAGKMIVLANTADESEFVLPTTVSKEDDGTFVFMVSTVDCTAASANFTTLYYIISPTGVEVSEDSSSMSLLKDGEGNKFLNDRGEYTEIVVDQELSTTSENPISNKAVATTISNVEHVVASALTDLDGRIIELESEFKPEKLSDLENDTGFVTQTSVYVFDGNTYSFTDAKQALADGRLLAMKYTSDTEPILLTVTDNLDEEIRCIFYRSDMSASGPNLSLYGMSLNVDAMTIPVPFELITCNGDGTRYLSDDGTYKTIETGADITVDTELSETSENPVQNKVVTETLNNKVSVYNFSLENFTAETFQDVLNAWANGSTLFTFDNIAAYAIYEKMTMPLRVTDYYNNGEGYTWLILGSDIKAVNFGQNNSDILFSALKICSDGNYEFIKKEVTVPDEQYVFTYSGQTTVTQSEYDNLTDAIDNDRIIILATGNTNVIPLASNNEGTLTLIVNAYRSSTIFTISSDLSISTQETSYVEESTYSSTVSDLKARILALENALANAALVAKVSASEYQEMVNNGTANDEYLYVITEDDTTEA